jgi:hypothetical protein
MANPEHVAKLKEGVEAWNNWRKENPDVELDFRQADLHRVDVALINLSRANLSEANLGGADLLGTNLSKTSLIAANISGTKLHTADLSGANLSHASLFRANLYKANLSGANLRKAVLLEARLYKTDLSGADLSGADLTYASLIGTNFEGANLTGCSVYGISAWDTRLEEAIQSNLVITPHNQSAIQVDNLEVAQFVYLLLNNERIRNVIDTITSKVVLILGRFTPDRKPVLDAIREELRKRDYLPILFDFQKPDSKDLTGTITTLANMARFIIADLTDPASVPHELAMIVPNTLVPVQTIVLEGQHEYAMFRDLKTRYHWVLEPYKYESEPLLLAQLNEKVIAPAEAKARQLKAGLRLS